MRLCNEIDYALRAMLVMASYPDELLSSKGISKKYHIPYNFLTLILPRLVKVGLIESIQGPKGGYKINRPLTKISVFDIVSALDACDGITNCSSQKGCEFDVYCGMAKVWKELSVKIEDHLKQTTLDQVVMDKRCFDEIEKIK